MERRRGKGEERRGMNERREMKHVRLLLLRQIFSSKKSFWEKWIQCTKPLLSPLLSVLLTSRLF
jgi:hypothetical protein